MRKLEIGKRDDDELINFRISTLPRAIPDYLSSIPMTFVKNLLASLTGKINAVLAGLLRSLIGDETMFFFVGKAKILRAVISLVTIYVMDDFKRGKKPTNGILHNKPVFSDIATIIREWMIGFLDKNIARLIYHFTAPPSAIFIKGTAGFFNLLYRMLEAPILMTTFISDWTHKFKLRRSEKRRFYHLSTTTAARDNFIVHNFIIAETGGLSR